MKRAAVATILAIAVLGGCSRNEQRSADYAVSQPAPRTMGLIGGGEAQPQSFSYNHFLALTMDGSFVTPRYKRARDLCLADTSFACELLAANVSEGNEDEGVAPSAQLTIMLPHAKVDAFEERIVALLPEEAEGSVKTRVRSTNAENVTQQLVDLDKRITQLTDYRDRLTALAKRPDVRAPELIQLADALSKVQAELEQVAAQQREAKSRVAKERLTITLGERDGSATFRPIARVVNSAGALLIESAADALRFVILSLPWLPIVAAVVVALGWLWRLLRGRRARAAT
jgi:hypothetical protein